MNKSATQTINPDIRSFSPTAGILQNRCNCGNHTIAGKECTACAKKAVLQRKASHLGKPDGLGLEMGEQEEIKPENLSKSKGIGPASDFVRIPVSTPSQFTQRVPDALREKFERVTGNAVGAVRLHTGEASQQAARQLNALAFTVGRNIHFGAGQFQPGTAEGDHLLAHELVHTVQQRSVEPTPQRQIEVSEPGDPAEEEADAVADTVLEDEEGQQVPPITERPPFGILTKPKKSAKKRAPAVKKPAKPKQIAFNLFANRFNASVDAANLVTVSKVGNSDGGWTFTSLGPNKVKAERTLDHAEYVHAGGSTEPLVERCTITVPAGGPATPSPIVAVLGNPPRLTIPLSNSKSAANRKTVVVNNTSLEQLDLPTSAITFTPADGDAIHLALFGDAWVFTSIKKDIVAPTTVNPVVNGFFRVGNFTRYVDHGVPTFGISTASKSDADRKKSFDDLTGSPTPSTRQITTDEAAMFKTVSLIESDFAGVQTYDTGILSFGFSQWTVNADLPRLLLKVDATTYERYLGRYGLAVGTPVRQLDAFVRKFVGPNRNKLGVRNPSEGALFLNSKELVNTKLLSKAKVQGTALGPLNAKATSTKAEIAAAKPDLRSRDTAKKVTAVSTIANAKIKVSAIQTAMEGLAGLRKVSDLEAQCELLAKVAKSGETAASDLVANCQDSEVLRGEEWALRFEMLGQSPGGQDAEIKEVRANWSDVSSKSTHGADFQVLLPNLRGKATLLSSYLNTHAAAAGVGRAVDIFKKQKQKDAKAAATAAAKAKLPAPSPTEADWKAFPWKSTDTRWNTLWTTAAIDEFEKIAIVQITRPTTDPERRRNIIKSQFP